MQLVEITGCVVGGRACDLVVSSPVFESSVLLRLSLVLAIHSIMKLYDEGVII